MSFQRARLWWTWMGGECGASLSGNDPVAPKAPLQLQVPQLLPKLLPLLLFLLLTADSTDHTGGEGGTSCRLLRDYYWVYHHNNNSWSSTTQSKCLMLPELRITILHTHSI